MTKNMTAAQQDADTCKLVRRDQQVATGLVILLLLISVVVQGLAIWRSWQ